MSERNPSLRLVWLEAFIITCETGNLTETAARLDCSRPMAGRYIDQLQAWYGKPLFKESRIGFVTDDGRRLREVSKQVLELLADVRAGKDAGETSFAIRGDSLGAKKPIDEVFEHWEEIGRLLKYWEKGQGSNMEDTSSHSD